MKRRFKLSAFLLLILFFSCQQQRNKLSITNRSGTGPDDNKLVSVLAESAADRFVSTNILNKNFFDYKDAFETILFHKQKWIPEENSITMLNDGLWIPGATDMNEIEPVDMVRFWGTPEQIGTNWGTINKEAIAREIDQTYLKVAAEAGISKETLIQRSERYKEIVREIAPHWLEEARAIARAADIDEELYLAFCGTVTRRRFLKEDKTDPEHNAKSQDRDIVECTSYAVPRHLAKDSAIFFHKTRDNVDRPQVAIIIESSLKDINKFIGVTNISNINTFSMIVNDKGLAIAADYPASRKKESSTLELPDADPKYQGLMGGIMRYIAERASSSEQALAILEDFVNKGYYAGGDVNGQHWLFVDRHGVIIEACNNSFHVVSMVHDKDVYFSRFNKSEPVIQMREADKIDFQMFRGISRERPILTSQSISAMTVEIDPQYPELLTVAWIAMPARNAAFPLFMGQLRTPKPLADGTAYALGKSTATRGSEWERQKSLWAEIEGIMHADKEEMVLEVKDSRFAGNPLEADIEWLENWSREQTGIIMDAFRNTGNTD